jgi:hypothetical protein
MINSQTTSSSTNQNSASLNDKRRSRNQNEKKRRDQFNFLIQGLGQLLNHPRKIDKATVLSETLYFFRNYNGNFQSKTAFLFVDNLNQFNFVIYFKISPCIIRRSNSNTSHFFWKMMNSCVL